MSPAETLIAMGHAILALDANAVTGFRRLQRLCNLVNSLRVPPNPLDIRLYVPAVVHMEVVFDLHQHFGPQYDVRQVLQGLVDKGLEVQPFDMQHAEHAAARLGASFPQGADWHAAKRKRCIQCLGVREQDVAILGSGRRCGATVDFVIAAQAAHEGWILVTDDPGPDFAELELKIRLPRLEALLDELTARRSAARQPV